MRACRCSRRDVKRRRSPIPLKEPRAVRATTSLPRSKHVVRLPRTGSPIAATRRRQTSSIDVNCMHCALTSAARCCFLGWQFTLRATCTRAHTFATVPISATQAAHTTATRSLSFVLLFVICCIFVVCVGLVITLVVTAACPLCNGHRGLVCRRRPCDRSIELICTA